MWDVVKLNCTYYLMYNNDDLNGSILQNLGGVSSNNLLDTLSKDDQLFDDNEITTLTLSPYVDIENLPNILKSKQDQFTILSLNAQSLHAKFDSLCVILDLLRENQCEFSVT